MTYDSFNATWTKFLHSEPDSASTQSAILSLLGESERELAKLFWANRNALPFRRHMMQTLTLHRKQCRDSSVASSVTSESSLSDGTVTREHFGEEASLDEYAMEEAAQEAVMEEIMDEAAVEEEEEEIIEEIVVEEDIEEAPMEDDIVEKATAESVTEGTPSVSEEPAPPYDEPTPVSQKLDAINFWNSWDASPKDKKNKKKKTRFLLYGSPPTVPEPPIEEIFSDDIVEETPVPEPEPEHDALSLEDDLGWGGWGSSKKDKKKKKRKQSEQRLLQPIQELVVIEEVKVDENPPLLPEAQPIIEDSSLFYDAQPAIEDPSPFSDTQPVIEHDIWGIFSTFVDESNNDKESLLDMPLEEEPLTATESGGQILEEPLVPETIEHPITTPPLPEVTSIETTICPPQPQVAPSGQTVVFTIQYPNEISKKPLHTMMTLAENTRAAIFNAINSYLDSKSMLKVGRSQRKIEILYGVGKNGDVDLSALEENMWPQYLDYFRQYTGLPELTVNIVDC